MTNNNTLRHTIAAILGGTLATASPALLATTDDTTGADPLIVEDTTTGSGQVVSKLSAEFSDFLGGEENARSVIEDLRDGSYGETVPEASTDTSATGGTDTTTGGEIADAGTTAPAEDAGATETVDGATTADATTDTTITAEATTGTDTTAVPETSDSGGKMGYGGIRITLKMAQAELDKLGITEPSDAELAAVLNGGTIDGSELDGILAMRAEGMGWGTIAKANGYTVGSLLGKGYGKAHNVSTAAGSDYVPSGKTGSGIATAAGTTAVTGKAKGHAKVGTASDYIPSGPSGKAYGHGMVSGLGGGVAAAGVGKGGGYKGAGVTVSAAGSAGSTASLASAAGKGGGHGLAKGHNK